MSWHSGGPYADPRPGPTYSPRNRPPAKGGPSGVRASSALQLKEHEPLFNTYEHLQGLPRADAALVMLRKVASIVKPIMRKHGWRVQVLAEFLPPEPNLLGLNINMGHKICIRLRYHNNPDLFLSIDQVVDTMLHELSHNVWGEHDANFHRLWDELRGEHEALARKGYTGEGFLGAGKKLGGAAGFRQMPLQDMRRRARESAEKRRAQGALTQGSGQRLGGTPLHLQGGDVRKVIADQVSRRNTINKGCASGRKDAEKLSQQPSQNVFQTKAEEDDANNRAIAQALMELMEEEEARKLDGNFYSSPNAGGGGLAWSPENGLYDTRQAEPQLESNNDLLSEAEQMRWALQESKVALSGNDGFAKPTLPTRTSNQSQQTEQAPPIPLGSKPTVESLDESLLVKRKRLDSNTDVGLVFQAMNVQPIAHEMLDKQAMPPESKELIDLTTVSPVSHRRSQNDWACEVCTLVNPSQFLACDACGVERPSSAMTKTKTKDDTTGKTKSASRSRLGAIQGKVPSRLGESLGWKCVRCDTFMEHQWWTCSACGQMKVSS